MRVLAFKFLNGQEIVAEVLGASEVSVRIRNPLTTEVVKGENGEPTMMFGQWSFAIDPKAEIDLIVTSLMALPIDVHPEIAASYEQQFSSIILPGAGAKQILHG